MVGPSLAAISLAATLPLGMGAAPLLALTAGGSLVMVLTTTRVSDVAPRPARSGLRWWQDLVAGLRFIAVSPVPGSLVLLAFTINALGFSAVFLMPAFAGEVFNADIGRVGLLVSAWGAGALLGLAGMILGIWDRHRRGVALYVPILLGLVLLGLSVSRRYEVSLCLIALAGALAYAHLTVAQTILQLRIPEHLRGRVMGIYVLSYASSPLGATLLGILASVTGTPAAVGVGAVVLCVVATTVLLRLRHLGSVA